MDDKQFVLIEKIKNAIVEMVYHNNELIKINFSDYLSGTLNHDYTYLANLCPEIQFTTPIDVLIRAGGFSGLK